MKKLLLLIVMMFSVSVNADDLLLGEYTIHDQQWYKNPCFDKKRDKCTEQIDDSHPLIGVNTDNYTAFVMRNSYGRTSAVFLRTFHYEFNSNIRPFFSAGIASGYEGVMPYEYKGITPVFYPGLDIHPDSDKFGVTITIAPKYFIGIGLRFNIGEVF